MLNIVYKTGLSIKKKESECYIYINEKILKIFNIIKKD